MTNGRAPVGMPNFRGQCVTGISEHLRFLREHSNKISALCMRHLSKGLAIPKHLDGII